MKKKAIVLLSGGLDSATTLYLAKEKGYDIRALVFDYGQRHKKEIQCAISLVRKIKCKYNIIKISLPRKGSALLNEKSTLPLAKNMNKRKKIPATYVPARNIIFLSFALSYAEAINAEIIFIGANAIDYSGYPDCRPEFYKAFNQVIKKGTKSGNEGKKIKICTPLINKTKAQIIRLGIKLGVPYELTWSCYKGGKNPCGRCEACFLRKKGFEEAI